MPNPHLYTVYMFTCKCYWSIAWKNYGIFFSAQHKFTIRLLKTLLVHRNWDFMV